MLKFDADGLIPAVVQDQTTRQVLMVGYMNEESIRRSIETGDTVFWSRSRQEYWHKGDTSGAFQHIVKLSSVVVLEDAGKSAFSENATAYPYS